MTAKRKRKRKKKKKAPPKSRYVWDINPKTRIKESKKTYKRSQTKKKKKDWTDDISWFQD